MQIFIGKRGFIATSSSVFKADSFEWLHELELSVRFHRFMNYRHADAHRCKQCSECIAYLCALNY